MKCLMEAAASIQVELPGGEGLARHRGHHAHLILVWLLVACLIIILSPLLRANAANLDVHRAADLLQCLHILREVVWIMPRSVVEHDVF